MDLDLTPRMLLKFGSNLGTSVVANNRNQESFHFTEFYHYCIVQYTYWYGTVLYYRTYVFTFLGTHQTDPSFQVSTSSKNCRQNSVTKHLQPYKGTMRVSVVALSISLLAGRSDAFRPLHLSKASSALRSKSNLHEFDYLLNEDSSSSILQQSRSRRRLHMNDGHGTILTSSIAPTADIAEEMISESDEGEVDPYAELELEQVNQQALQIQKENQSLSQKMENRLKEMDFQDVVTTLIVPSILAFAGLRWTFNKAAGKVGDSKDAILDSFASEMIYHDGDFEEMKLCYADYSKKLMFMGPTKTNAMLKKYLEIYSKKRTVSPQAIRRVYRNIISKN